MMRGVSNWAVAVRKPSAEQLAEGERSPEEAALGEIEVTTFPLDSAMKRHRLLRLPIVRGDRRARRLAGDRLSRARGLGQRAASARRTRPRTGCGARGDPQGRLGGHGRRRAGVAIVLFFLIPVGLTSLIKDQLGSSFLFWLIEGARAHEHLPRLHAAALAPARPAARVRVPRRRAQDDLLLRGRPAADARQRAALLAPAPALRHELPAGRDDRGDLRVRADRPAGLVLAGGDAHPRRAGDRRHLLRADQVRRTQPQPPLGARGDVARPEAAAADHARARPRPARGRDRRAAARCSTRETPGELSAEDLVGVEVVA